MKLQSQGIQVTIRVHSNYNQTTFTISTFQLQSQGIQITEYIPITIGVIPITFTGHSSYIHRAFQLQSDYIYSQYIPITITGHSNYSHRAFKLHSTFQLQQRHSNYSHRAFQLQSDYIYNQSTFQLQSDYIYNQYIPITIRLHLQSVHSNYNHRAIKLQSQGIQITEYIPITIEGIPVTIRVHSSYNQTTFTIRVHSNYNHRAFQLQLQGIPSTVMGH